MRILPLGAGGFIGILRTLHKLGLDRTDPVRVGAVSVSPRDVLAACLPDPRPFLDLLTGYGSPWACEERPG